MFTSVVTHHFMFTHEVLQLGAFRTSNNEITLEAMVVPPSESDEADKPKHTVDMDASVVFESVSLLL